MDLNDLRILITVVSFIVFAGIVYWAYSSRQRARFIEAANLPCWMLDTDYNGLSFYATQVFFPKTAAWDNLKRSLGATYDDSVWDHLAGTTSEPFAGGQQRRIAVKVIDERGNELMRVVELP